MDQTILGTQNTQNQNSDILMVKSKNICNYSD